MTRYSVRPGHHSMRPHISGLFIILCLTGAAHLLVAPASCAEVFRADGSQDAILEQIGVDENLGGALPGDAEFLDQDAAPVKFGDYMGGMPAILVLNFYECPMICPVTFRKLTESMNRMSALTLGEDYRVIALSFNPDEIPALAKEKAELTYGMLDGPAPGKTDFPFLTGGPESIGRVTGAVGYRYVRVDEGFAHPAVVVILTPDGRISRYLYGIEHDPRDLKLALIEASGGSIGGPGIINKALLYCYQYDPDKDGYALVAVNAMKLGGLATLVFVGGLLLILWLKEKSSKDAH